MRRERREWRNYHLATLKQHASQDHQVLTDEDPCTHGVLLPAYDQPYLAEWKAAYWSMQDSRSQKAAQEIRARPVLRHDHQRYPQQARAVPPIEPVPGN